MNQLTFIDKINVLIKLLFSSPAIIGIFAFSMLLMILLFFYSKFNKKIMKYIFIILYVAIIGFSIFKYGKYFLTSIDSFVTLFMANIYFPIIPVYVVIMLISFFIMVFTLSSKKKNKIVKIINTVFFTLIQMLFALFIYIVETSNIDISSNSNLYSNEQTMTLLELGMGLFVLWMFILLLIFYLSKADKIFKGKKNEDVDDFDEYINDYNEPSESVSVSSNNFNKSVIQSLVPEMESDEEEVISLDDDFISSDNSFVNTNNVVNNFNSVNGSSNNTVNANLNNIISNTSNNSIDNVFNNFQFFEDSTNSLERKNDDVEVVDFDI